MLYIHIYIYIYTYVHLTPFGASCFRSLLGVGPCPHQIRLRRRLCEIDAPDDLVHRFNDVYETLSN